MFFFFQAEDGIRDLVRSRGLGDVYKRQVLYNVVTASNRATADFVISSPLFAADYRRKAVDSVSYTHLTLPTSDLV